VKQIKKPQQLYIQRRKMVMMVLVMEIQRKKLTSNLKMERKREN